jgi:glutamate--cysteine ligase
MGIEVEMGVLDTETGVSVPYEGPAGLQAMLKAIEQAGEWSAIYDGENLMALERADGGSVKLEHGGAIEYSTPPVTDLTRLVEMLKREVHGIAEAARRLGVAYVPGGNFPFNTADNTRWVPKARGRIMRDYFIALGRPGAGGPRVMSETLSTQVTLDYTSSEDMGRKMRTLVAIAPIATAIFANSPLEGGQLCGALSRRAQHYFTCDPQRCGFIPPALGRIMSLDEFIEWASELPMIYRAKGDGYVSVVNSSFADVLREGFGDGLTPTPAHWRSHLSQI